MRRILSLIKFIVCVAAIITALCSIDQFAYTKNTENYDIVSPPLSNIWSPNENSTNEAKNCTLGGTRKITVVMYHKVLNSREGVYVVSEKQLENDLVAFKAEGYQTVFSSEVADFVKRGGNLPEKPLVITFDDGHYNVMAYAVPLLKKYKMKAEINVVGAFSEFSSLSGDHSNPEYSHLTWNQIQHLAKCEYIAIGSHSFNMHAYKPRFGISQVNGENEQEYRQALKNDTNKLQKILKEDCGVVPTAFAFPFGKYTDIATEILIKSGIEVMYTCNEGISLIKRGDEKTLTRIKRINRNGCYSSREFVEKLKAII